MKSKSYIKDSADFVKKIKGIQYIPNNTTLDTADVCGICPSFTHDSGIKAFKTSFR